MTNLFPRAIRRDLLLFCWFMAQFTLWRAVFALFGIDYEHLVFIDAIRAFFVGLRLDAVIAAYLTFPLFIAHLIPLKNGGSAKLDKILKVYLLLATGCVAFTYIADIYFFKEFASHLNIIVYSSESSNGLELIKFIVNQYPVGRVLLFMLAYAYMNYWIIKKIFKRIPIESVSLAGIPAYFLVMGIGLVVFARGGIQKTPVNWGYAMFSGNQRANQIAINPIFYFGRSMIQLSSEQRIGKDVSFFSPDTAIKIFNGIISPNVDSLSTETVQLRPKNRPHVVLLVLESFVAKYCGHLTSGYQMITPTLDSLAANGMYAINCIASGQRSAYGLSSILTGYPAIPGFPIILKTEIFQGIPTIASALHEAGYKNLFLYGGDAVYDNMENFAISCGYDEVIDRKKMGNLPGTRWGIYDHYVFNMAAERLKNESSDDPLFITLFTTTNHVPYKYPENYETFPGCEVFGSENEQNIQKTMAYTDHVLKQFMDRVATEVDSDVLFVLVADHGLALDNDFTNDPRNAHIPLVFYGLPGVPHLEVDKICSQTDISHTMLDLLNIPDHLPPFGQSLRLNKPGFALHLMNTHFWWLEDNGSYEEALGQYWRMYRGDYKTHMEKVSNFPNTALQRNARAYLETAYFSFKANTTQSTERTDIQGTVWQQ